MMIKSRAAVFQLLHAVFWALLILLAAAAFPGAEFLGIETAAWGALAFVILNGCLMARMRRGEKCD